MPKTRKGSEVKIAGPISEGTTLYRALQLVAMAIAKKLNMDRDTGDPSSPPTRKASDKSSKRQQGQQDQ